MTSSRQSVDLLAPIQAQIDGNGCSTYLGYLPAAYRDDDFMGRFLLIFESILSPIEEMTDSLHLYFDPALCPDALVPWLSTWVALVNDERLPLNTRRRLIKAAAEIYRWRGTRRGLKLYLQMATSAEPLIIENTDGIALGKDSRLGINTRLGIRRNSCVRITLLVNNPDHIDVGLIRSIIESEKPAHVAYTLEVVAREDNLGHGGASNGS